MNPNYAAIFEQVVANWVRHIHELNIFIKTKLIVRIAREKG